MYPVIRLKEKIIVSQISLNLDRIDLKNSKVDFEIGLKKPGALLTLDFYSKNDYRHPDAHLGWWSFSMDELPENFTVQFDFCQPLPFIITLKTIDNKFISACDYWINNNYNLNNNELHLLLVIRDAKQNILELQKINFNFQKEITKGLDFRHWYAQQYDPSIPLIDLDSIFVELTNHCNINCLFCPNDKMTRKRQYMDYELALRILDEISLPYFSFSHINLSLMGEPLLHPRFLDIVNYAEKEKKIKSVIVTNGIILIGQLCEDLLRSEPYCICLSFQTPSVQLFKIRRAGKLTYSEYKKRIENVIFQKFKLGNRRTKIELHILNTFNFTPRIDIIKSYDTAMRVIDDWANFGQQIITEFGIKDFNQQICTSRNILNLPEEDNGSEILPNVFLRFKRSCSFGNSVITPGTVIIPRKHGFCPLPLQQLGILANGDCTCCCMDYDGKLTFGNLKNAKSLASLWYSEKATKIREGMNQHQLIMPFCQYCRGYKIDLYSPLQKVKTMFNKLTQKGK